MCTNGCRTFLWGGAGQPSYGADGQCSCICEDNAWSDRNILGRASCVPATAHETFGWVGLGISVGVLCHAAYHLRRQNKSHQQNLLGSCTPVERCRWQLHVQTLVAAAIGSLAFILVLGDALRWCTAVLALAEAPAFVGGSVLAGRMWVYTNDPRLLRESPRVSAMSCWLERPLGIIVAGGVPAIFMIVAAVLALADLTEMAAHLVAIGGIAMGFITMVTFMIVGRALLQAIDKSLQNQRQQQQTPSTAASTRGARGGPGKNTLLDAKRKVKTVVIVDVILVVSGSFITLLAVVTGLYTGVPLVMFGVIFGYTPLVWLAFNIQVHGGRSGSHRRSLTSMNSGPLSRMSGPRTSLRRNLFSSTKQEKQVVPTEVPC